MQLFRIADLRAPLFDGTGAALYGGRWNSPGRRVIYASGSYACAMLEKLVQTGNGAIPKDQHSICITVPEKISIETLGPEIVKDWDHKDRVASQKYGDQWLKENRSLILLVPSAVARYEMNAVINQDHPDVIKLVIGQAEPVLWDQRIFSKNFV